MIESLDALHRSNPRARAGFAQAVGAVEEAVRARIGTAEPESSPAPRRRLSRVSLAGVSLAAAGAAAALLTVGLVGGGPGVESAAAAVEKAATVTAASAERSGTAVVRITHDGRLWAGTTVRWNGGDLDVARETPNRRGRPGSELRVVDGTLYGIDVDGGWIVLGSPDSIDPGSGTTPDEYLAAVREDVGGVTLRRITRGMTGLTTGQLADGATVYSGRVAAGLVARESGFKEGQAIRVLPFGYVAHDEAANPAALLDVAVTVAADGIVRGIDVTWGSWTYTVTYRNLGATAALVAPENAKPFPDRTP